MPIKKKTVEINEKVATKKQAEKKSVKEYKTIVIKCEMSDMKKVLTYLNDLKEEQLKVKDTDLVKLYVGRISKNDDDFPHENILDINNGEEQFNDVCVTKTHIEQFKKLSNVRVWELE